ncbi:MULTISPECIES: hypothetical protein [unclassified Tolypothrix]|nr:MULTISPECIES: hypothetical protein [unclassified Tolypothrix]
MSNRRSDRTVKFQVRRALAQNEEKLAGVFLSSGSGKALLGLKHF